MQWSNSRVNESMLKNKRRQNFDLHNFAKGKSSTMQARRFLQFAALVCVVISSKAFWSWSAPSAKREIRTPVILVPGTAGSQLEAKLDRPSVAHWYCSRKTSHFFTIWVKVFLLLPFAVNCWDDNMRLLFDEKTNKLKNVPGVEIRVPGFGETYTVEYLDDEKVISYFASMVERMVSWGYERGVSVRAAPYDYRYGPESQDEFYKKMKRLIEETYSANGNKRITLMTHSMGGPLTLVFLNRQTSDWKDKYLHQWIALSAPFGGAVEEIRTYTSGNTLFVPHFILNPLAVRREQRTDTSNIFMLPSPELWSPDEVLLQTPHRTYTVNDYDQLFEDIGFPLGKKLRRLVGNLTYPLSAHAPNITVHCLHGSGIQTAERLTFSRGEDLHNTQPEVSYGDGDSLVNIRSLEACEKWSQRQAYPVILKQFPSVYHNAILVDEDAQNYVKNLLF